MIVCESETPSNQWDCQYKCEMQSTVFSFLNSHNTIKNVVGPLDKTILQTSFRRIIFPPSQNN